MKDFGYILDDNHQIKLVRMMEYFAWWAKSYELENPPNVVRQELVSETIRVSTVFLPLMCLGGKMLFPPFETMVFLEDGKTGMVGKYQTWKEAEAGHKEIVLCYKVKIQ